MMSCVAANSPPAHAYRYSCPSSADTKHQSDICLVHLPYDFASRNAPTCTDIRCQICTFIKRMEDSVVQRITTADITSGKPALQFSSNSAWLAVQSECPDMLRTKAHLRQGTRPSKKITNARDVQRTRRPLVVRRNDPFSHARDCVIAPRPVLDGLITALHIQFDHPSTQQVKQVMHRYLYAFDLDKAIQVITHGCHHCASLRNVPHTVTTQSTNDPKKSYELPMPLTSSSGSDSWSW